MALGVLIACEETLGQLYGIFAEQSLPLTDFWHKMALDEHAHANWLRTLVAQMQNQTITYKDNRFQPDPFRTFLSYLQERVSEARTKTLADFAALAIAVDCEGTFVEQNFFVVLEGDTIEMSRLLAALASASLKHQQEVKAMWERYRPRTSPYDL